MEMELHQLIRISLEYDVVLAGRNDLDGMAVVQYRRGTARVADLQIAGSDLLRGQVLQVNVDWGLRVPVGALGIHQLSPVSGTAVALISPVNVRSQDREGKSKEGEEGQLASK
ncbi:hypothetical protein D9M71_660730 [compost metagenome]